MRIHLSPNDGVPIYLQIVNQIKYLAASGRLQAGAELPPIRTLAEQLLINPNTVARAYRELEAVGMVSKRRTTGTYISDAGSRLAQGEQWRILTERADGLLADARQMGVTTDAVIDLIHSRDAVMSREDPPKEHPEGQEKVPHETKPSHV